MRNKTLFILQIISLSLITLFLGPKHVFAAITFSQNPNPAYIDSGSITFTLISDKNEIKDAQPYTFAAGKPGSKDYVTFYQTLKPNNDIFQATMTDVRRGIQFGTPGIWRYKFGQGNYDQALGVGILSEGTFFIYGCNKDSSGCPALAVLQKTFEAHTPIPFFIVNAQKDQKYGVWLEPDHKIQTYEVLDNPDLTIKGFPSVKRFIDSGNPSLDLKRLCITQNIPLLGFSIFGLSCDFAESDIKIVPQHVDLVSDNNAPILSNRPGVPDPNTPPEVSTPNIPAPPPPCATLAPDGKCRNVNTAIGLISTDPQGFVKSIFNLVLGLAGGIALILIMVSGYKFMTSSGNPEATKAATEQLTSAIIGLLFIIFAFVILQIIGVDILRIPGFGE